MDSDQVETRLSDLESKVKEIERIIGQQTEHNEVTMKAISRLGEALKALVEKIIGK